MGERHNVFGAAFHRELLSAIGLDLHLDVGVKDLIVAMEDLAGHGIGDELPLRVITRSGVGSGDDEVDGGARLFGDAIHACEDHRSNAGDFSFGELVDRHARETGDVEIAGKQAAGNREAFDLGDLRRDQDGGESGFVADEHADGRIEDGGAVDMRDVTDEHELRVASHRIGHEGKNMVFATPRADREKLLGRHAPEVLGVLRDEATSAVARVRALRKGLAIDSFDSTIDQRTSRAGMLALERHPSGIGIVTDLVENAHRTCRGIRSRLVQRASLRHREGAEAGNHQEGGDDGGVL